MRELLCRAGFPILYLPGFRCDLRAAELDATGAELPRLPALPALQRIDVLHIEVSTGMLTLDMEASPPLHILDRNKNCTERNQIHCIYTHHQHLLEQATLGGIRICLICRTERTNEHGRLELAALFWVFFCHSIALRG